MKFLTTIITASALITASNAFAEFADKNITDEIAELSLPETITGEDLDAGFTKVADVTEYKGAEWDNVIGVARDITLDEAYEIANADENIDYFFYMKGYQMILEKENGDYRVFCEGDAVFFSGTPHWGSAISFSDGYIKN